MGDVKEEIRNTLVEVGILPAYTSYKCWMTGLSMYIEDNSIPIKKLYADVGNILGIASESCRGSMRQSLREAWMNLSTEKQKSIFGYALEKVPTNQQFFKMVEDKVQMSLRGAL